MKNLGTRKPKEVQIEAISITLGQAHQNLAEKSFTKTQLHRVHLHFPIVHGVKRIENVLGATQVL